MISSERFSPDLDRGGTEKKYIRELLIFYNNVNKTKRNKKYITLKYLLNKGDIKETNK